MTKRVADRGVACLGVLAGVFMVAGCSDLTNSPPGRTEAGVTDGGKVDGKAGNSGSSSKVGSSGSSSKAGNSGSSSLLIGGASGGAGGSSSEGGQSSSSSSSSAIDAGVDTPVGGSSGGSSSLAGSGGTSEVGGSSGGSKPPVSSGGTAGSNSRDAGHDLRPDAPVNPTACTTAVTCPGPTGGNGTAVCPGGTCSFTCNNGYHRCGNACVANNSPANCGNSCSPCTSPASNGTATCSGNPLACGIRCDNGFHACGTSCVANGSTSASSCGNTCTACQAPANGSVTCNGINCVPKCNSGYHLCSGVCRPNNSVESCGTGSCFPCPVPTNGSPTCDGTRCDFECNSNYHKCGSECASNIDATRCGTECTRCPGDPNGTPECWAGACRISCKDGYHYCENVRRCVPNGSTALDSCGNSCLQCTARAGYQATCIAGLCGEVPNPCPNAGEVRCGILCVEENDSNCGLSCDDCTTRTSENNYHWECKDHACAAVCDPGYSTCLGSGTTPSCFSVDSTSLEHCGGACTACPNPGALGSVSCTGETTKQCSITCEATAHLCGSTDTTCYSNDSLTHCGSAEGCEICTAAPSNASPACLDNKCDFTCQDGFHRCDMDSADPCKANNNSEFCGTECIKCETDQVCEGGGCVAIPTPDAGAVARASGS